MFIIVHLGKKLADDLLKTCKEHLDAEKETRGQFHQRSTRSFYVRKLPAQLFVPTF
jgi:hypothetical protein